uniref:Uncharacterized protein n=1 Tax=Schistocephalus solidus TaxID=70667 RepID=A0A0X3Q1Z6_SCHSO
MQGPTIFESRDSQTRHRELTPVQEMQDCLFWKICSKITRGRLSGVPPVAERNKQPRTSNKRIAEAWGGEQAKCHMKYHLKSQRLRIRFLEDSIVIRFLSLVSVANNGAWRCVGNKNYGDQGLMSPLPVRFRLGLKKGCIPV